MIDRERVGEYHNVYRELQNERQPMESVWQECTKYTLPSRNMWGKDENAGEIDTGAGLYDSQPVADLQILGNGMVGWNAGPASPWFRLKMATDEINELPYVMDWLEDCEKRLYIIFAHTNFYDSLTEFYLDMGSVGTATMLIEEHPLKGVVFSARHPKETYIMEGPDHRVDSVYRDVWLTGRQAIERYGHKLEDRTYEAFKRSMTKKYLFLHVVHPRSDRDLYSGLNIDMPYASIEMYEPDGSILAEGGYVDNPVVVGRWRKNSSETYGRSPAMDALADIKNANLVKKTMMDSAQLSTLSPLQMPKDMARRLNMMPLGINVYKEPDRLIRKVDVGGAYPFARDVLDGLHGSIEEHFFVDLFKMLGRMEREMTAREVAERQGERVTGLSGPLTRQNSEVLKPSVKRVFNISLRNHWFLPPPPALLETGLPIDVDFVGLLSMAQKQYYQANGLNRGMAFVAGLADATQDPAVWDNVNKDELVRSVIDDEGFPQKSIEERPIVEKKRAARAAAMQKQQQLDQASQVADMSPKLAKAPEKGSPGEEITKKLAGAL